MTIVVYDIETDTGILFISPNPGEFKRLRKFHFEGVGIYKTHSKHLESFPECPSNARTAKVPLNLWYPGYSLNMSIQS